MYRLLVESLLGLKLEAGALRFNPCLPAGWKGFSMRYRHSETTYHIKVVQTQTDTGETEVTADGLDQKDGTVRLVDDRREHAVQVRVNAPVSRS